MRSVACLRARDGGTPLEALKWLIDNVDDCLETKLIGPCPDGQEGEVS